MEGEGALGQGRRARGAQPSPPAGTVGAAPALPSLFPKGRREPCASPRDCDKHYTEAINV